MDIHQFRDFVNRFHHEFVYRRYSDVGGKDHWSCLCSAMDWLTEAGDAMPEYEGRLKAKTAGWSDIYGFISCIDVIVEATEQLHRCVCGFGGAQRDLVFATNHLKTRPKEFRHLPDREYFKQLRAGFGAHPVNLKHPDGKQNNGKTWKFASWVLKSGQTTSGCDFEVRVYSGIKGEADSYLGVNVSELRSFCNQYRDYLKSIAAEIGRQYTVFAAECRKRPIEQSTDAAQQWNILLEEAKQRCLGDWDAAVPTLLSADVGGPKNRRLVIAHRRAVQELIGRMTNAFQQMDDATVEKVAQEFHQILYPPYPQTKGVGYCLGKLFTGDLPYSVIGPEIESYFEKRVEFDALHSDVERQVVVRAALWNESNGRRPPAVSAKRVRKHVVAKTR